MRWRKLGRIFCPEGQYPWMVSHASVPFAEPIEGDLYRIYFTSRDAQNRSHIGWVEIDVARPDRIVNLSANPVLGPGSLGRFDDCGAMMSWLITYRGQRRLYYVGWNTRGTVPFHVSIGLAMEQGSSDAPVLEALPGPVLERSVTDPFFCSNPCVLVDSGLWRMWYISGIGWADSVSGESASYDIRHAESADGLEWRPSGRIAIGLDDPGDYAIGRPSVIRDQSGYTMWYCVRTRDRPYRLGVAHSADGLQWVRHHGEIGLQPSRAGWDSEMIAYPHVFNHGADTYMVYCGNGFGRTGFGLAVRA